MLKQRLPIVKVIGHTEFHGVPDDLLPLELAEKLVLEERRKEVADTAAWNARSEEERKGMWQVLDEKDEKFLEGLPEKRYARARRIVFEKGQDQGTTGERLAECAGRACYDSFGVGRPSKDYHAHIMDVDHGSVTEHVWINFFLSNLSRGLTHELVRHRVGIAISQRSTRYVDENESPWIWHPLIHAYIEAGDPVRRASNGEPTEIGMETLCRHTQTTAQDSYTVIVGKLQAFLIGKGIDKFTARKQARGAARGLLGNALLTEMVWSVNIRTLRGTILKQRANGAADAEIGALAILLWEQALPYYPNYLGDFRRRPRSDGLGDELYLPNSPVEKLKVAEAKIIELENKLSAYVRLGNDLPNNSG